MSQALAEMPIAKAIVTESQQMEAHLYKFHWSPQILAQRFVNKTMKSQKAG
jgi:hypothetical protein